MIELVKSSVVFSEENHTYFLGEKQLKGITGMISRQLFPNKYKDIPEYILKRAAEKGSRIHGQCQFADVTGLPPESIEAINYIRERVNAGYKALPMSTLFQTMNILHRILIVFGKRTRKSALSISRLLQVLTVSI